jgi:hypothetical protein
MSGSPISRSRSARSPADHGRRVTSVGCVLVKVYQQATACSSEAALNSDRGGFHHSARPADGNQWVGAARLQRAQPNEKLDLLHFHKGIHAVIRTWEHIATT